MSRKERIFLLSSLEGRRGLTKRGLFFLKEDGYSPYNRVEEN
ncbi:unnamed protein product [Larinioides sclopetarius]|uniref:Uncharacterized protein n=1 Tax=Larinioides sclopetarius TaxID=280406 RepID=A0AAV1ZMH6_9ARAC